jgi:hypothetical protein
MASKIMHFFSKLKNGVSNLKHIKPLHDQYWNDYKSTKVNLGQIQAYYNSKKKHIVSFNEVEFQVFSQFGDDGIIQWLLSQIPIPNKTFIEFGVENYRESNTRFLLFKDYWAGLVIDGNPENIRSIKSEQMYNFYDIQAECSFITKSNINKLISLANFSAEIGILSIDIDGNDYWIWEEIKEIKPIIIICEYNSLFGFESPYTIEYEDNFVRGNKYPFNFYGTSLKSIYNLAMEKGYQFIGSNSAGNNAYFIKNEYFHFLSISEKTPEEGYVFASFSEAWDKSKNPIKGIAKIRSIDSLPVFNTETKSIEAFNSESVIQSLIKSNKTNRF